MKCYERKSFEELRFEDYSVDRIYGDRPFNMGPMADASASSTETAQSRFDVLEQLSARLLQLPGGAGRQALREFAKIELEKQGCVPDADVLAFVDDEGEKDTLTMLSRVLDGSFVSLFVLTNLAERSAPDRILAKRVLGDIAQAPVPLMEVACRHAAYFNQVHHEGRRANNGTFSRWLRGLPFVAVGHINGKTMPQSLVSYLGPATEHLL